MQQTVINDPTIYKWYFANDLIASDNSIERLINTIAGAGYIQPNLQKLNTDLTNKGEFVYGMGLYKIIKEK